MNNNFIFNNRDCYEDMKCIVIGQITLPTVSEDIELIEVEGRRSGSLKIRTNNFKDLKFSLKLRLINMEDYKIKIRELTEWFENIKDERLFFLDNPLKCYKVKYVRFSDITGRNIQEANFQVEFICNPFMYYTNTHEIEVSNNDIVYNEGYIESEPLIKLHLPTSPQNITLNVNGNEFQIKNVSEYVEIDSELFRVTDKQNMFVTNIGNFPALKKGENTITWNGNINKFIMDKRVLLRG